MIPGANGLPAYTLPPTSGGPSGGAPTDWFPSGGQTPSAPDGRSAPRAPFGGPPSTGAPSGVGSPGGTRQPFGGSAAQVSTPPARSGTDGADTASGVPQQRGRGTVYGGVGADSPIDMTMPITMNAVETSGSLTGHILAQGWDHGSDTHRRSNVKVGIAMALVLLALVGVSLLFLFTAGNAFTNMIHGVLNK